jgi:CheY-like chemotaxis protein
VHAEKIRVLVVDDDRDSAEMLQTLLGLLGHDVQLAHDGQSALASVAAYDPQVVFLDITLPDMNGYDVARKIRAHQSRPIRLIALTGWARDDVAQQAREAGFDHCITKPADPDALQKFVSE